MIPGVSRSGATILGAMSFGVDRKTAAEFSFFLAVPTLTGATVYKLYKARDELTMDDFGLIGIGSAVSFVVASSGGESLCDGDNALWLRAVCLVPDSGGHIGADLAFKPVGHQARVTNSPSRTWPTTRIRVLLRRQKLWSCGDKPATAPAFAGAHSIWGNGARHL